MAKQNAEGEEIEACKACGGIWLHRHQLNRLLSENGGDVETASESHEAAGDERPIIRCGVCAGREMRRISFLDYSDIILGFCPSCGSLWLDRGELERMHEYLKKIEEGSRDIRNTSLYDILVKLSRIAYSIFHIPYSIDCPANGTLH